jgi:ribosomal protein S10(archaeal)/S20(eukaryotic)
VFAFIIRIGARFQSVRKARVKVSSNQEDKVDELVHDIVEIGEEYEADVSGPVPLPTQSLTVPTRKAPDGEGSSTIERWEMHVHRRLVDLRDSERALRQVMRVHVPEGVDIEVEVSE